jgi:disulfide bond formation protein DsbB
MPRYYLNYYLLGFAFIFICFATWMMDWYGLVSPCIYCRTERTIIGVLGLLLMLPVMPFATRLVSYTLGFFGAYVSSQQMWLDIQQHVINEELILATCALIIIMMEVVLIHYRTQK